MGRKDHSNNKTSIYNLYSGLKKILEIKLSGELLKNSMLRVYLLGMEKPKSPPPKKKPMQCTHLCIVRGV
jgi:hypothetical protein